MSGRRSLTASELTLESMGYLEGRFTNRQGFTVLSLNTYISPFFKMVQVQSLIISIVKLYIYIYINDIYIYIYIYIYYIYIYIHVHIYSNILSAQMHLKQAR